ncbi:hypothetical protein D3C81_1476140 [compost metagenome]
MHTLNILFRNIVRACTRIRNHFMLLIKCLCDIQGLFGRVAILRIRLALQQRQVIQLERIFLRVLYLVLRDPAFFPSNLVRK